MKLSRSANRVSNKLQLNVWVSRLAAAALVVGLLGGVARAGDPGATGFTYQGRLNDGGNPAQGVYDLRFTIYDSPSGGAQVGSALTNSAMVISNGLFTVTLDFGGVFDGDARWLEIAVRTNGSVGGFTTLAPRQPLTPAPYALYTPNAGAAATAHSVAAANVTGVLALAQLPGAAVTNNATAITLAGTFSGHGGGLTNLNASQLASGTLADTRLSTNVALRGTTNTFTATNVFTKPVGIDCMIPGRPLQVGNANTFGSQGIIRLASRSTNSAENRIWDIGVPQSGSDLSGAGYSFVIDDTQFGTDPEFIVHWGTGRVGIGRTNPVSALDVNGTVTATGFAGNAAGLTNLNAVQLTGIVPLAQLPGAVVTNNATGLNLSGTFSGNGAGVTNVNLLTINDQGAIDWTTNATFVLASSPGVGAHPYSVTSADVNGDGKLDLIDANAYGSSLSVLTNNGSGGFVLASTLTVGATPLCVIAVDVSGDGKVDLISANSGANTLSVLTNNGSGGFVLAVSPAVGASPHSVAAADVNGDGKMDLISANRAGNSLSVLTNNGSGGFVLSSSPGVGASPYSVAAADVNGDGKVDLISANQAGNSLSVLTNNGSGGFVLSSTLAVGLFPLSVVAADVNGDGKVDLISANNSDANLSVLTNNSSGGFVLASSPATGYIPWAVVAADVNGDGRLDLINANYGANSLSVLTNKGGGGFALACSPSVGTVQRGVTAADVDGDGRVDLISANSDANTLSVLFNTPAFRATFQGNFAGDGSAVENLDAAHLATGTVALARLPGAVLTNNASGVTLTGTFAGNGTALTNVNAELLDGQHGAFYQNATNLTSGTLTDARLSTNVALLNANQVFSGSNRFTGVATLTNVANTFAGAFTGNASGLTNLNASQLAVGTVPLAQLPGAVVTNNATGLILSGTFAGNGPGLTNLNASQLSSGTLADARLSANVALLNASQSFTGTNSFRRVGIGTTNTSQLLQIGDANTLGAQGMIRLASRSTNSAENRIWDIGVPQTGSFTTGVGYSFVIDDTQLGTDPEFVVHWGNGYVGIGRTNPATALDVNGTVTATGFTGNGGGLTNLDANDLTGTVPLAQLPGAVVTNNATGLSLSGTFAGNGASMTNVNLMNINDQGAIGWTTNWGNFVLASSPAAGNVPVSVTAADVNGDGKPDLINANQSANTLRVMTNNGSGGFVLASSPAVGSQPGSVVAADINGDGEVDLISANSGVNTLSVLTNNGSGGFVLAGSPAVGASPLSVAAGDVNGDGKLDLISANSFADTLSVLTNNGTGGFALASSPSVGSAPMAVAAADINGDGKVDLISADLGWNSLSALTNDGSGGFALASRPMVGSEPTDVIAADVNGDGKLDLISANRQSDTLSVLTNNGSGGFVLASSPAVGVDPEAVTAADVNGDGKLDLISVNRYVHTLSVLVNKGSGSFVLASTLTVGGNPNSVVAADVNGDGKADLISANAGPYTLSVLFNGISDYSASFQGSFTGDGSGLQNLDATELTGTIADARLSANVALLNANQALTGANRFAGVVTLTNTGNLLSGTGTFSGNGGGLTNLNAANLTGTIADARLSANVALANGANVFTGTNRFAGVLQASNVNNQLTGAFTGNGGGLSNLNATSLTGTVADSRLSTNVALLNGTNTFTGTNKFTGEVQFTGTFYGSAPYLKYAEVTANVSAGASVAGTNNWREFNTELTDTHNLGSTSGGDINLPAGTYYCRISAPAFRVTTHQTRLRTSTGTNLLFGTVGYADEGTSGSQDRSQIEGQFTLAATTTLRVQHWCTLAHTEGLGHLGSFNWGDANQTIFAVAEFWKIR